MTKTAPILQVEELTRRFFVKSGGMGGTTETVTAVDGVSFSVQRGETLGLVGESGCGKSTLARMIVRLLRPSSGRALLDGASIWNGDASLRRSFPRRVQMVFQDPFSSLNPRWSVGAAIGEPLAIHRQGNRKKRKERVAQLLEWVGLAPEHASRYPHEFSGGQRQRVAVARALALNPDLVALDEPVSALDVSIQAQVLNLLAGLQNKLDLTYLFISHDLSVVSHVSDRVAVMYMGRLVEMADAAMLYADPLHPYTRTLLAAAPVPDPDAPPRQSGRQRSGAEQAGETSGCRFAPRCAEAKKDCFHDKPQLREIRPGRWVACYNA